MIFYICKNFQAMKQVLNRLVKWIKHWFWEEPVKKDPPLKATDVAKHYICMRYHNQWVNLRKSEIQAWNRMPRKDKRAMAQRFAVMEAKGHIRFTKLNDRMICIKNRNYESRAHTE